MDRFFCFLLRTKSVLRLKNRSRTGKTDNFSSPDVNVVYIYGGWGEGWGVRGFKMFCQTGSEFFLLALCVCVGGGGGRGGRGQVQYLSFREKK